MSAKFAAGTAGLPTTEVELSLSCRSLACADLFSKSDPMCVTFIQPFGENRWVEYHRTEVIDNCHDPEFASKILMAYRFEEQQYIKFEVYDVDSASSNLSDHDFLGRASCTLAQIVSSGKVELPLSNTELSLPGDRKLGSIVVVAEELAALKDEVVLQFSGHQLEKKDWWWFSKSDPFLVLSKVTESGAYTVVHRTEVVKRSLDPRWRKFSIPVRLLCNGDYDRSIKITCCDWNSSGEEKLIGECHTTLKKLGEGASPANHYRLVNPQKASKSSYKSSGEIRLEYFEIRKIHSFMDYIRGGMQLHCTFAIDFTASNGDPTLPASLHHVGPSPNLYEQAILAVGTIVQDYDSDKMFPVLGFGARIPPTGHVSHEFFVNMDPTNPYCRGIEGVLAAYRSCIQQVQLFGPTNFAPVINHIARFAATYRDGSNYFILLILTDGVITDMPQTTQALVEASTLPMSLIIVGIGKADFTAMETLDADTVPLQSGARRASRDIVQFVPFSKFLGVDQDPTVARMRLAQEVLAEIPTQVVSYMKANSLAPRPPLQDIVVLPPDPTLLQATS